jgi:RHS repeat-associated protein
MLNHFRRTFTALAALAAFSPVFADTPSFNRTVPNRQAEVRQEIHQQFPKLNAPNVTYQMTGLPGGLSFDATKRLVTGDAKKAGSWNATYTATDANGVTTRAYPVFTVSPAGTSTSLVMGGMGSLPSNAQMIEPVDTTQTTSVTVNAGVAVTFEGVSDGGKNPLWTFSDTQTTVSGFGPLQHTFQAAGDYTVTFGIAPDINYESSSVTLQVHVNGALPAPTIASFTASPTSLLVGQSTTLSWSVTNATSLSLSNVGTVTGTSSVQSPTATTTYVLTAQNGSGTTTASTTVSVAPVVVTLTPKPTSVAPGSATVFSASVSGAVNTAVDWSASGGSLSATTGASVTWTAPASGGPFTITAASAALPSRTDAGTVSLSGSAPVITASPTSQTVTAGATATFSVSATGGGTLAYQWRKNGTDIAGASSATYTTPATQTTDSGSTFLAVVSNAYGSATSASATLTVNPATPTAPTITTQPASRTVAVNQTATFSVVVSGTSPFTYQWRKNGSAIPGATASTYTTPPAQASDTGSTFNVVVSNSVGSANSINATLTVLTSGTAPSITVQPQGKTVSPGQTATFSVTATGTAPLSYQWKKGGVDIPGATASSYTTPATQTSDNGSTYTVVITNPFGGATSSAATLTVVSSAVMVWKRDIVYLGGKEIAEVESTGAVHTTLVDHLGSPRLVVGAGGAIESEQKYLPFGEALDRSGSLTTLKGFTNHEQTDPSGLIYMQARFYGPMYHRFLSPDPARDQHFEQTQSWNIYSYVQNNPVMKFDPTGEGGFWAGVWDGIKSYPGQVWQTVRHPIQTAERQQAQRMASVDKHGFVGAVAREAGKEFVKALPSGGQLLAAGQAAVQASGGDTHGAGKTLGGQLASDVTTLATAYAGAKLGSLGGAGAAGGEATAGAGKVETVLQGIDDVGAKVQMNPLNPATLQEVNATIKLPDGRSVNVRVETHPIPGSNGQPVRHGNVDVLAPAKNKTVLIRKRYIEN